MGGAGREWGHHPSLLTPLPPPPCPTEGHKSVSIYKNCMKLSDCYSGFVSTTMSRDDYMVTNARCCQSDGCNRGTVPRECQLSTRAHRPWARGVPRGCREGAG